MKIKTIRIHLGVTQEQLAHCLGVTPQCVYLWESGRRRPALVYRLIFKQLARVAHDKDCRQATGALIKKRKTETLLLAIYDEAWGR